jgi:hypothetical protein
MDTLSGSVGWDDVGFCRQGKMLVVRTLNSGRPVVSAHGASGRLSCADTMLLAGGSFSIAFMPSRHEDVDGPAGECRNP